MQEELLQKVFEPFFKVAPERGFNSGYGLGLSLCRRIVELHGGSIVLRTGVSGEPAAPRISLKWPNDLWLVDAAGTGLDLKKYAGIDVRTVARGPLEADGRPLNEIGRAHV